MTGWILWKGRIQDILCGAGNLKGHFCSQIIFFILDSLSRHNSKTPHVLRNPDFDLKSAQILENVPLPVLAKTSDGIGQIADQY